MVSELEHAIGLAIHAHAGQVDKQEVPYILHLLRVMLAVSAPYRVAAVLHDLYEDTDTGEEEALQHGISPENLEIVAVLTRSDDETYEAYIKRVSVRPDAKEIKIADLRDNMARMHSLPHEEQKRLGKRYAAALRTLGASVTT